MWGPLPSDTSTSILQKNIADIATIHMEFKSGLKSHISVSWLNPYKEQKLVVVGKSAILVFDDTKSWSEKLAFYSHKIEYYNNLPVLKKTIENYIKVNEEEPLKNECQHFVSVVEGNLKPLTDIFEGLKVLKVLTAASLVKEKN